MNSSIIEITSESNSKFKLLRSLGTRAGRKKSGKFFVEGPESIVEAMKEKINPEEVFVSRQFFENNDNNQLLEELFFLKASIYLLSDNLFKKLSFTENPKGIIMVSKIFSYNFKEIIYKCNKSSLYIMCERIQDPGNLGTIIRSADSAGADAVFLSKGCVDLYNPKTIRASMGSIFNIPIINVESIESALNQLKDKEIKIYSTLPSAQKNIFEVDFKNSLCILIGNEGQGLTNETIDLSDEKVKIPMPGKAQSLNASIAAGILLYEITRQRLENNL